MSHLYEKIIESNRVYSGKIFTVKCDRAELSENKEVLREVVEPCNGVVIAAEIDGKILMVKQFRYPVQDVLYELPAGKLDKGNENELAAAKRELQEETGYSAKHWESLGYIWTTPGFCSEKLHLFKASNLKYEGQNLDEDEFLDFIQVDKDKVFNMIKLGIINDAKSIAAVMRAYIL